MKHSLLARAAAVTATLTAALAGAVVVASPAHAALVETKYGFFTHAFGTKATAHEVGLSSGPTAHSMIGCTRIAGKRSTATIAAADAPSNVPMVQVGAVASESATYKAGNGDTGARSSSTVASIAVGSADGPRLVIKGLETSSAAWADKHDRLHTAVSFELADITAETGTPIDSVLNRAGVTMDDLADTILAQTNDTVLVPGVARVSLGNKVGRATDTVAIANAVALRIVVFVNGEGGSDDVSIDVGRSHTRIYRRAVRVFEGGAWAADVTALGGLAGVGKLGHQTLECHGSDGKILTNGVALLNLGNANALQLGTATGRVFGQVYSDESALAWTEGRLASLTLGTGGTSLHLGAVVGRAQVRVTRKGKVIRSATGTQVGSIRFGDQEYAFPGIGRSLAIPGLGTLHFGVVDASGSRGIRVTAVQIVLLPDVSQQTGLATINLGLAKAGIRNL
jgi:hypothetical protein